MKKLFLLFIAIVYLISLAACSVAADDGADKDTLPSWKTVVGENFEGALSGDYQIFDNDGTSNGEYYWAKSTFKRNAGSYSLWAIGGGVDGNTNGSSSHYPDNCQSWMILGPYDFSKATDLRGKFYYWLNSESGSDFLKYGFSTDGENFNCNGLSGNTSGGWAQKDMGLASVKDQILGKSQVWFAFIFTSGTSINLSGGAYIDDILIEKYE